MPGHGAQPTGACRSRASQATAGREPRPGQDSRQLLRSLTLELAANELVDRVTGDVVAVLLGR
jgi:hypothetical protein